MLIKYYFTLAIRRMVHMNKVQGAVAILGLALSMAASILLFRYVYQETTVDHCIPDHEKWVFLTQKRFGRLTPMDNNKDFFSSGYIDPLDTSLVEKVTKFIPLKDIKLNVTDFQVTTNALDVDSNFHYLIPLRTYLGKSYPTKCNEITISKELSVRLFDKKQRYREIALRKVNGAKLKDILPLLIKKYLIIQLTAFIVSIPVVLWVIHQYTRNMVDYAHPAWWMFTVALIMTMAMAMATLISQIYKATNMNPAEVLKNE